MPFNSSYCHTIGFSTELQEEEKIIGMKSTLVNAEFPFNVNVEFIIAKLK